MTASALKETMAAFLKVPTARMTDDTILTELVRESFLLIEMVMYLQDELSVRIVQEDLKGVERVGQLVEVFLAKTA